MATFDFLPFTDTFSPSRCAFNVLANTKMTSSAVNNTQIITENPGELWQVRYFFRVIFKDDAFDLDGVLTQLRGHVNKIRLKDTTYAHRGTWSGSPLVDGDNQYGLALNVKNLAPNQTVAYVRDRFRIGDQLFKLAANAQTDAQGKCTLILGNEIRQPVNNNTALITDVDALYALCRWADPKQIMQLEGNRRLYQNITLDFVEAL